LGSDRQLGVAVGYVLQFMTRILRCAIAVLGLVQFSMPQQDLRALLPADCAVEVGVAAPVRLIEALESAIGDLPPDLPAAVRAMAGVGLLAARNWLGAPVSELAATLAGGGAVLGLRRDGTRFAPFLVTRPAAPEDARDWLRRYPDVETVIVDGLLLASSTAAGCAELRRGLAARAQAVGVGERAAAEPMAWLEVDLVALRDRLPRGAVGEFDGGQRFLLAPAVAAVLRGERLRAELTGGDVLRLVARVDASTRGTRWGGLLAVGGAPRPAIALPADGALQITIDRSLGALLGSPARFLSDSDQLGVQEFLSIAELLAGPKASFVDDLVGGLQEPFVLSVLGLEPAEGESCPIRLPGVALTAAIDSADVTVALRRAAQVLATIINAERLEQGRRPFVLRRASSEFGDGLVAEPPLWRGPGLPPVEDTLTPTLMWSEEHVVLATTRTAAEGVMRRVAGGVDGVVAGDVITLHGDSLARLITANRRVLELGRMLDEGETMSDAARFFDIMTAVAAAVRSLVVTVDYGADATTMTFELERRR